MFLRLPDGTLEPATLLRRSVLPGRVWVHAWVRGVLLVLLSDLL